MPRFRYTTISDHLDLPAAPESAEQIIREAAGRPDWDNVSVSPEGNDQFPSINLSWHAGFGFVVQCFETPKSRSDFLISDKALSAPEVYINLGGQAQELWPRQLFVPPPVALEAIRYFLDTGREHPKLEWARIDRFPRRDHVEGELMDESNKAQIDLWNGRVGEKWAAMQVSLDAMLAHATAELKSRAGSVAGRRVLDIGCGTGETLTIWLAGGAEVTGVDVSAAMLAVAAERTDGRATLIQADASVWSGDAPFDMAVSRFGLMFFDAPDAAFANIAGNVRPAGRLLFTCWRAAAENQWVTTPFDAIRDLLPDGPAPGPHAPGPFALADRDRLRGILERAGFADVAIDPVDFPVCLASEGGLDAAVRMAMQTGPSGAALAEASKELRAAAAERLGVALAPHDRGGVVKLGGAIWMVEAVRAGRGR